MDQVEPGDDAEPPQEVPDQPLPPARTRRKFLPRNVKITLMVLLLFFIGEYILLPELASARRELHRSPT